MGVVLYSVAGLEDPQLGSEKPKILNFSEKAYQIRRIPSGGPEDSSKLTEHSSSAGLGVHSGAKRVPRRLQVRGI